MNSIRRLKDKYEEGIKELKKEQKRKELEYLRNRNIILIILGSLAIIAIMFSGFYCYNLILVMTSLCVSVITFIGVTIVMKVLQYNYENGWDRKIADRMIWVTIVLGVILIGVIIGLILFKFDEFYLAIMEVLSVVIMLAYLLWIASFLEKKPYNRRKKVTITDTDWKRVIFLKNLLEREKFCFDDIAKIQIIIDELTRMKRKVFPFVDINQFIIKPLIVLWLPLAIAFFDYWIKNIKIDFKIYFLVTIFTVIISLGILVFVIIEPVRYLLYGKYDALISDLRLLQIIKEEKENQ